MLSNVLSVYGDISLLEVSPLSSALDCRISDDGLQEGGKKSTVAAELFGRKT